MQATLEAERKIAAEGKSIHGLEIFQGTLGWRFLIAGWPKIMQQLVGLTVFNSYATYFCKPPSPVCCLLASLTPSPTRGEQRSFHRHGHSRLRAAPLGAYLRTHHRHIGPSAHDGIRLCSHGHCCLVPRHRRLLRLHLASTWLVAGASITPRRRPHPCMADR